MAVSLWRSAWLGGQTSRWIAGAQVICVRPYNVVCLSSNKKNGKQERERRFLCVLLVLARTDDNGARLTMPLAQPRCDQAQPHQVVGRSAPTSCGYQRNVATTPRVSKHNEKQTKQRSRPHHGRLKFCVGVVESDDRPSNVSMDSIQLNK